AASSPRGPGRRDARPSESQHLLDPRLRLERVRVAEPLGEARPRRSHAYRPYRARGPAQLVAQRTAEELVAMVRAGGQQALELEVLEQGAGRVLRVALVMRDLQRAVDPVERDRERRGDRLLVEPQHEHSRGM